MIWLKEILKISQLKVNVRYKKMKLRKLMLIKKKLEEGTFKPNATDQGIQPKKKNRLEEIESEMKKHEETELSKIKTPPKRLKRGKPEGAELTVIGLPSSKKSKRNNIKLTITPFFKLKGVGKDKII